MKTKRHTAVLVKRSLITIFLASVILLGTGSYPTTSTALAAGKIPSKAKSYDGNRYYIFNECVSWSEAKAKCEELGGHLVCITSAKEQAFIEKLNASEVKLWIGGYREDGSSKWKWVTGEKWKYTNWADGEPNDSNNVISNENRCSVWPIRWNDLNEGSIEQDGYICEWESNLAKIVFKTCKNTKSRKVSLSWEEDKNAEGYEIMYADNSKLKGNKSIDTKKTTCTIKKLEKNKTYYIRARAYEMDGGKKVYGGWSKVEKVVVKK